MGRQNNNAKQNGTSAKITKPTGVRNRNLRTQNGSSSKKSNTASAASNSKPQSGSSTKAGSTPAPDDKSTVVGVKSPSDRSQLNFPFDIRIDGFTSMLNTIKKATPKVRRLLLDECDIIMECKFCRNLFRSVPNFLSHKQNYCKTMYHPSSESGCSPLLPRYSNNGIQYDLDTSAIDQLPLNRVNPSSTTSTSCVSEEDLNTDNGMVIENGATRSSVSFYNDIYERTRQNPPPSSENPLSKEHVKLVIEPINNRQDLIVFQRRVETDSSVCDSSNNIYDTREVVDRDTAILGPDGKVLCTGTALGIERIVKRLTTQIEISQQKMVQESTNPLEEKCDICKTVFTTEKALRQHRRDAPDCVKQSTVKYSQVTSNNGKSLVTKRPSKQQTDEESGFAAKKKHEDWTSSSEQSKTNEDKAKSSLFVKKLFSKSSPLKGVNSVPLSPSKSPMFAKKLLAAKNSQKTSPFKRIGNNFVKRLQMPSATGKNKTFSPVKKWNSNRDFPFSCIKCSSSFQTQSEMSMHLALCTGVINLSLKRDSFPSSEKKICIQVRHNYSKSEIIKPCESIETGRQISYQNTSSKESVQSFSSDSLSPSCLDNGLHSEKSEPNTNKLLISLASNVLKAALMDPTLDYPVVDGKDTTLIEQSILSYQNVESSEPALLSVTSNRSIDGLPVFNGEVDNSNASSGSEVDRERYGRLCMYGNVTDSGVSSTTTPSEDHPDPHGDLPVSLIDLQALPTSSKIAKSESRSKKNSNPEDRVLTPKNKNLRLVNSRMRKSSRIQIKDRIVKKSVKNTK